MKLNENATILFQGDSITDANRNREDENDLGVGYAFFIAAILNATYPRLKLRFINRGIGGNRVADLAERWDKDCLDIDFDVLSVLIGVNETWIRYDGDAVTTTEEYYKVYKDILTAAKTKRPNIKIVIMEPFVLPIDETKEKIYDDLDGLIKISRKLAAEFEAVYIPLDGLFAQASAIRMPAFWSDDGVHPSAAGHMLIAQNWIKAVATD